MAKYNMILLVEYYHSGYGRRRLPHCVTNNEGPEKFGICGRPVECTHDHRATKAAVQQIKKFYSFQFYRESLFSIKIKQLLSFSPDDCYVL